MTAQDQTPQVSSGKGLTRGAFILNEPVKPVKPDECSHESRAFFRQPWSTGDGQHVLEACTSCGANVRGPGVWVPRSEVLASGQNPDQLPQVPSRPQERSLFDEGGQA